MESGILGFGIRKKGQGIWNPTKDWNPEYRPHCQILESSTRNLESAAWNPESKTYFLDSLAWGNQPKKHVYTVEPVTRTLKGNEKQFELAGNSSYQG